MLSTITVSLFGLLATTLTVGVAWAVLHNMERGESLRRALLHRLQEMPLRRALTSLGVDPRTYLYSERVVDVERHMRACSTCPDRHDCTWQRQEGGTERELAFCPNYQVLRSCQRRYGTAPTA